MATCLEEAGKPDLALVCYGVARTGEWDGRFGDLRWILDLEYFGFLGRGDFADPELARRRRAALAGPRSMDLVVVISWNTDGTDVDLHVTDPTGEECFYSHQNTAIGGRMSADVTQGHGPEMFVLENAVPGTYAIRAHCFASDNNRMSARTTVFATIYEGFGSPSERVTRTAVTLASKNDVSEIASVAR
jgi:hypothetical protein